MAAPLAPGDSTDAMLRQIVAMLEKSQLDIASLRHECADLRQSNIDLERQVKSSLSAGTGNGHANGHANGYGYGVPGGHHPHGQYSQHHSNSPSPGGFPNLNGVGRSPVTSPRTSVAGLPQPPAFFLQPPSSPFARPIEPRKMYDIKDFWAVVPAGGAGTRLWPLSREACPKFLLDLTGRGRTLIQNTWDRLLPLSGPDRLVVVTGQRHAAGVRDQLPELQVANLLAEPSPRESAGAIGLAAAVLARRNPEAVLGSFAADHMISGADAFEHAVVEAVAVARAGHLVTIGIAPSSPATGFGYIKLGDKLGMHESPNARTVLQFKEKPDARTAAKYLATGDYRWNAGMFVVKATVLMDLLEKYEPNLARGLNQIADVLEDAKATEAAKEEAFQKYWHDLPKIAIDHAVAEPAAAEGKVAVVPATFGWDDVGDFTSLAEMLPAEPHQPRILGDHSLVVTEKVAGGVVIPAAGRVVALLGVDDVVVVDTPDALLVTTHARSQEVKKLVARCKEAGKKHLL